MATGVQVWSQSPASNATADSNINWAEGQAPSSVNDSARALMASVAKWRDDNTGTLVTSGSSSALTVISNQVEAALTTGFTVRATLGTAIGAAATLAVDGLAATSIFTAPSTASLVTTGQFSANQVCAFMFSTGVGPGNGWVITSASPVSVSLTNSLGGNTALSTGAYSDGPSVTQSTFGTWFASGQIVGLCTPNAQVYNVKLWDGTTVINSAQQFADAGAAALIPLSGVITNPTSNIRISAQVGVSVATNMVFNQSGNSKDCTLTAVRIG